MSDDAEFGPWIEHDGMGCPIVGRYWIEVVAIASRGPRFVRDQDWSDQYMPEAWDASFFGKDAGDGWRWGLINRYRIRRWIEVVAIASRGPRFVRDQDWSDQYMPEAWDASFFGKDAGDGWRWGLMNRYRIRRPKALRDLITLVETLPTPAPVEVDA